MTAKSVKAKTDNMSPLRKAYCIIRYLGPRIVWLRAQVYMDKYLGLTRRRFAPQPWNEIDLANICSASVPTNAKEYARFKERNPPVFLFPLGQPPNIPEAITQAANLRAPTLKERMQLLEADRCVYFFHTPSPKPINWFANPFDDAKSDPNKPWCDIPDYLPEQGDPRMLWEPSRAAWAIDFARAPSRGFYGDHTAYLFRRWVDSWTEASPPFMGFQWKCGQESSVRFMAIALGFWSLAGRGQMTADHWVQFARLAWATGYRIKHHINYAISQKNNHAMSEACGLMLISQLFPEFNEASEWNRLGRRVMSREILRQTYSDGSYCQQSMNYERVMLQGATMALRLAELSGEPFSREVYDRLGRCGEFLFQMMDLSTGKVPQYGNNDGAWVLPLDECDFWDFRPVIQSTHYLVNRTRKLPEGPWDEDLYWLFGASAAEASQQDTAPCQPQSSRFDSGGYYTLRSGESWLMTRCHNYRDRVGHSDALHVDMWWRGQNILRDCGTYKYYIPGRTDQERYFPSTRAHNTVELDHRDATALVSRFLAFPFTKAAVRHFAGQEDPVSMECCFHGYQRRPWKVSWRRAILALGENGWVIVDDLIGAESHNAIVRWHFMDTPYNVDNSVVRLDTSAGKVFMTVVGWPESPKRFEVVKGQDCKDRMQGWASTHYGHREPVPVLEAEFEHSLPMRVMSVVSFNEAATISTPKLINGIQHWDIEIGGLCRTLSLAKAENHCDKVLHGST